MVERWSRHEGMAEEDFPDFPQEEMFLAAHRSIASETAKAAGWPFPYLPC